MRFAVLDVKLSNHTVETIRQEDLRTYPCPICRGNDAVQLLAEVRASGLSSLESAFCKRCFHRFHRKFPSAAWLENYYLKEYESAVALRATRQETLDRLIGKRARIRAVRVWRALRGIETPNRLFESLDGVLRGSDYYRIDPAIRKVLEIGCGYGDNLSYLVDRGYEAHGTEASPIRVEACRRRGLNVSLTGIESFDAAKASAPYDFIYSTHVLEHVIDVDSHLRSLAEMLRDDGYLYLETPHLSGETFFYQAHTIYHVQTFSQRSMQTLLRNHGLNLVRISIDNNLRVLAQKRPRHPLDDSTADTGIRDYSVDAIPYLELLARLSPGEFRVQWDHYRVKISDTSGRIIYEDPIGALHVHPGPNTHEIRLASDALAERGKEFPVVFDHVGTSMPAVWCKQ